MQIEGTALVTGGAGFLGSHLVDELVARGTPVVVVDSLDAGSRDNLAASAASARFIEADVRDRSWWPQLGASRIDTVFHYAANASVPRSTSDPLYDLTTNIQGTFNMLELAREHGAKFVFISSAAVYGSPQYLPTDEGHPTQPISNYGASKLAGELYVNLYRENHGLDTRTVRYFNCYGPRQPRYIVFDFLKKAELPGSTFEVLGTGQQIRTQLFVQDAVKATLLVADRGDHLPYNIGSERTFSVIDLAEAVLEAVGRTDVRRVPTGTSWVGDIQTLQPSVERLKKLGFVEEYTLTDGLKEVLIWWRKRSESQS